MERAKFVTTPLNQLDSFSFDCCRQALAKNTQKMADTSDATQKPIQVKLVLLGSSVEHDIVALELVKARSGSHKSTRMLTMPHRRSCSWKVLCGHAIRQCFCAFRRNGPRILIPLDVYRSTTNSKPTRNPQLEQHF